jgi:hypothetical protein
MKKDILFLLFILLLLFNPGCKKNTPVDDNNGKETVDTTGNGNTGNEVTDTTGNGNQTTDTITNPGGNGGTTDTIKTTINRKDTITLTFQYGENGPSSDYKNIYVIWLEAPNFIQNMYICKKLIVGGLTNTALPYWKVNKYPLSTTAEIDAVTGATKPNCNFTITTVIKDTTLKDLTINFETDRSFDPNDWFDNQPAILYQATLKLNDTLSDYELLPVGWTPNEDTENQVSNTPMGKLQNEMRYITNYKDGSGFGEKDQRGATKMVKKITVKLK